ncbi:MAG: hypothetical protein FJW34_09985 [Acidobacteria bacterium]|nr:hypothetical protein [Acidobacteriota bacterium]
MSVGPDSVVPSVTAVAPVTSLAGVEGELLAVRISVEPRLLEQLLDTLAQLEFPISPQIYHHAALHYEYADGGERREPTTTVEFPAYADWLPVVRQVLEQAGLPTAAFTARGMLEELTAECEVHPGPPGASYRSVTWYPRSSEPLHRLA